MAKTVYIGSARIDENGHAHGGRAGDQTGKEVSTQAFYVNSKGWVNLRAKDPEVAEAIAACMEAACANDNIGYNQYRRNALYNAVEPLGFDVALLTVKKETDCSALVRVCNAYAGVMDLASDTRTTNLPDRLMDTGLFDKLTASKYTTKSAYLKRGDILNTKTQGHVAVVLNDGYLAEVTVVVVYTLGSRTLRKGMNGDDVEDLQEALLTAGHDPQGIDGAFGPNTESAVKAFQTAYGGLEIDGIYGPLTHAALMDELDDEEESDEEETPEKIVRVTAAGTWYIRKGPGTGYGILTVVKQGRELPYVSVAENSWLQVEINGETGWVSPKCAEVAE